MHLLTVASLATVPYLGVLSLTLAIALTAIGCGGSSSSPSGPSGAGVISLNGNLDFGTVLGGMSRDLTFSISNSGNETFNVSGISLPSGFTASWSSGAIAPSQTQNVTLRFTPTLDQNYSGTLTVASSAASGPNTLAILARGSRTGRVNDPIGDTQSDPRISVAPDLTEADIRAAGGVLSITLTSRPARCRHNPTSGQAWCWIRTRTRRPALPEWTRAVSPADVTAA